MKGYVVAASWVFVSSGLWFARENLPDMMPNNDVVPIELLLLFQNKSGLLHCVFT